MNITNTLDLIEQNHVEMMTEFAKSPELQRWACFFTLRLLEEYSNEHVFYERDGVLQPGQELYTAEGHDGKPFLLVVWNGNAIRLINQLIERVCSFAQSLFNNDVAKLMDIEDELGIDYDKELSFPDGTPDSLRNKFGILQITSVA